MFEEYSSGYYFGRLYVEPFEGDRPAMQREQHELVNKQLYTTGEGLERVDAPLVMKLENHHFPVEGNEDVPGHTLALPEEMLGSVDLDNPPTRRNVYLAKADRADQLLRISGYRAPSGT